MPAFEYQAFNPKGKKSTGVHEADTARQVRSYLREQGLTPLKIEPVAEKAKKESSGFRFKSKVSTSDLALLTRQLATLVAAAMPIEESLKAVGQQCEKPKLKSIILGVRSKVVEGYSLADSMAEFPDVFEKLYCAMVAAGEKSGHLDKVLDRLADYTEQRQAMRMKTMQALIYPAVLTFVCLAVIAILLVSVVPKVVAQFEHMGQELPNATKFLIYVSELVSDYGLVFVLGSMFAMVVWQRMLQKDKVRMKWHQRILGMPVVGKVSKGLNTARFARTLSILNASAVPLLEGMGIAGEVLTNDHARAQVLDAASKVREGSSLHSSLEATKLFPPMMLHMIASGERSGELEGMLERAADNQDRQFEMQVNIALGIFEPALIVTMAGIVLFIVMAILLPILELNNMVGL
ncbi:MULTISPECIES: type II secretion system inner membrane protein GspF [unclassified Agarivorans]|uniref:type II secretion system inner membrane protein GspF n=1 Tax=unclassified Agarivorans TaxID=2636026 RepID=UPI0010DDAD36|nr:MULTISPECIES: type II secretion system inner membrane protein GspF [unclassified Agarivorans]MDO6687530.1 type II secretion system inner membrane protein GspF [Agarivorans sp. 3_MG-2023]MDO6717137.1 type II secretion system inner membrane protein GspF [Agarivorans sp. 2_MG-2023]MDO6765744.1 type II secretion system inner membrane protein GspF [Agarivorans sp. 1_MG-2023]GDY27723.1 type II secretion system protein GspF [Agarivorans sp. Toyoura001]